MDTTQYWVHDLDPIMIRLWGDLAIRYYGLAYVLAFVIGTVLLRRFYKKGRSPLDPDQQDRFVFALVLGVMLGGRLGYVILYALPEFLRDPFVVFRVWEGGMASHGGFIGVILACWVMARRLQVPLLRLGDLLCPLAPAGLLLGRIANFINGELWGKVTDVPWAVIFPQSAPPGTPVEMIPPRHPSQLYEAALEGGLLLVYAQWRFWKTDCMRYPGRMSGEFLMLYAVARIFCEIFRAPDAPLILGLSRGMFYSLFMIVAGAWLVGRSYKKAPIDHQQT